MNASLHVARGRRKRRRRAPSPAVVTKWYRALLRIPGCMHFNPSMVKRVISTKILKICTTLGITKSDEGLCQGLS